MAAPEEIKIYVLYYKDGPVVTDDPVYEPVMAGNALRKGPGLFTGDDTGDNISGRNRYYSELTAIYWVWKNTRQKVTGCVHYRRFLTMQREPFLYRLKRLLYYPAGLAAKRQGIIYTRNIRLFAPRILSGEETGRLLETHDAVLPVPRHLQYSAEEHFRRYHRGGDLEILRSVLADKQPGYLKAFEEVMEGKRLYANNLFIMKEPCYGEFMEWWFDMLSEFERRIDCTEYTGYQERVLGFVAERLLNVWFRKKQLKVAELPVIYFKRFKRG